MGLNRAGGRARDWKKHGSSMRLVQDDGMSQVEVAKLLGRHNIVMPGEVASRLNIGRA